MEPGKEAVKTSDVAVDCVDRNAALPKGDNIGLSRLFSW
jgi:hypothetical protein